MSAEGMGRLKTELKRLIAYLNQQSKDLREEFNEKDMAGILHELFQMQHAIASVGKDLARALEKTG